jgi:class 3 adenylate cyclase
LLPLAIFAQDKAEAAPGDGDSSVVNALLLEGKNRLSDTTEKAMTIALKAKSMAEKIGFPTGAAYALKLIGQVYKKQGKYPDALENYRAAIKIFEEEKDNVGLSNLYNSIGNIYYDQSDDVKALENYLQSLKFAELSGDKLRLLSALNNVGGVYTNKRSTYNKALEYYLKALPLVEEMGKKDELGTISANIGIIYAEQKATDSAMFYFNKALKAFGNSEGALGAYNEIGKLYNSQNKFDLAFQNHFKALALAEKLDVKISIVSSLMGLGNVYLKKGEYKNAITYFKKAEAPAKEVGANLELKDIYEKMSTSYARIGDYSNAFQYQSLFSGIKDTLYNIENDKKLGSLQFDFDLQKKQGEINLLTKDVALTDLKLKRQRLIKNAFMVGLALVFIIAIIIYRNYRNKIKVNKLLDRQNAEIESLILNILPEEVAHELQKNGNATPRYYESASVLFTDFKSFSRHADTMSPQEVVTELNECFVAFDEIINKFNLEKIKTIGDSYMCAGGIPTVDDDHYINIIRAALEIRDYMDSRNHVRRQAGLQAWDIRIGVNTGPIVAGVVGRKKYAYDIWGGTVNVASRMESNGEPGRVNISAATYEFIKHKYSCLHRGKIMAKNVGEVDMYFVEDEIFENLSSREMLDDIAGSAFESSEPARNS